MNPNDLLEQFLGVKSSDSTRKTQASNPSASGSLDLGSFGGGALAGGILGLLLGNKKARKMAGGVVGYGGAAAAGAMAYKAYQSWQQGREVAAAPVVTAEDIVQVDHTFQPAAMKTRNGQPFQLVMINAMIAAAKADGHVDAAEMKTIFDRVEKMSLDAESKAFVFDALSQATDIDSLVSAVNGVEQAAEVYLVSRLAVDVDHPAERIYLDVLANKLSLPRELVTHLDHQADHARIQLRG